MNEFTTNAQENSCRNPYTDPKKLTFFTLQTKPLNIIKNN